MSYFCFLISFSWLCKHPGGCLGLLHVSKGMFAPAAAQNLIHVFPFYWRWLNKYWLKIKVDDSGVVLVSGASPWICQSNRRGHQRPFVRKSSQSKSSPQHALYERNYLNYICSMKSGILFLQKIASGGSSQRGRFHTRYTSACCQVKSLQRVCYWGYYSLAVNFPRPRRQRGKCFSPARCPTRRPRAHSESRNLRRPRAKKPGHLILGPYLQLHCTAASHVPPFFPLVLHSFSKKILFPHFTYIHYVYYVHSQHVFMQCPLLKKLAFHGRLAFRFVLVDLASQEAGFPPCPWQVGMV